MTPLHAQVPRDAAPAATPASLVLRDVTVINVRDGARMPERTVVIQGNRIQTVAAAGRVRVPAGARVVDARGKYLIPGLWDMHVHPLGYVDIFYPLLLANGVTGMRDAGSPTPLDTLQLWRREILAGTRIGPPRQLLSGPAIDEGTAGQPCEHAKDERHHTCVPYGDTVAAQRLVDSLQAAGADLLKMYGLSERMYFVIAAEARRRGIPFGGHVESTTWRAASDSGAGLIDHLNSSGGLDDICLDVKPHAPGVVLTVSLAQCQEAAQRLRQHNTWLVPTALVMRFDGDHGTSAVLRARFWRRAREFSAYWPDSVRNGTATSLNGSARGYQRKFVRDSARFDSLSTAPPRRRPGYPADSLGLLALAERAGLPLLAGTDAAAMFPFVAAGFSLHAELAVLVAEGVTPIHALQAATLNPAIFLHATDSLGTVATGKLADLVLLDADPLADITNTSRIRAVVANGRYYDRAALDAMLVDAERAAHP